ncbi:MAG TPA: methionyl-tRNA formyltransferase [Myxococcales bacterium]
MRVLLFGIYKVGSEALDSLIRRRVNLIGVVTKSDSNEEQPVARVAREHQLPLFMPDSPSEERFIREVTLLSPDLIAVSGYHKIIPETVLSLPRLGVVNMHASLLPAYRGPSPWKWAIIHGEVKTGVTVHLMSRKLDAGDILAQEEIEIEDTDTGGSLFEKLCPVGAELLAKTIEAISFQPPTGIPQDERLASYYPAPKEADARIRWRSSARDIHNLVRGLHPRPGAWTSLQGVRLGIQRSWIEVSSASDEPGTIIDVSEDALKVATGNGVVRLQRTIAKKLQTDQLPSLRPGMRFDDER